MRHLRDVVWCLYTWCVLSCVLFCLVKCSYSSQLQIVHSGHRELSLSPQCWSSWCHRHIVNRVLHSMNVMCRRRSIAARYTLWMMVMLTMVMMMTVGNWSSGYYQHIVWDCNCDFVTCLFRVTFWSLSTNLNNYELVPEPDWHRYWYVQYIWQRWWWWWWSHSGTVVPECFKATA